MTRAACCPWTSKGTKPPSGVLTDMERVVMILLGFTATAVALLTFASRHTCHAAHLPGWITCMHSQMSCMPGEYRAYNSSLTLCCIRGKSSLGWWRLRSVCCARSARGSPSAPAPGALATSGRAGLSSLLLSCYCLGLFQQGLLLMRGGTTTAELRSSHCLQSAPEARSQVYQKSTVTG